MLRHLQITETTRDCMFILSHLALPNTGRIHCTNVDNGPAIVAANYASISATDRVEVRGTASIAGDHPTCPRGGLRPDDITHILRARARVGELILCTLHRRDLQGVEFRAFSHLVRLALAGQTQTAMHSVRHLARSADDGGVLSSALETFAVDFHPAPSRGLAAALRNEDLTVVEDGLRKVCAELARVLSHRAQKGARLARLEFGCTCTCTDESGRAGSSDCKGVRDLAGPGWVSWRSIVEPLEGLVDGPVVFTGYRFFSS